MSGRPGPRQLLVVCTGNICRSPAAQLLAAARLGPGSGVLVSSAGLAARVGEPVDPPVAELLARRGIGAAGFTARQLTPDLVRAADVVLTMTSAQRAAVVTQVPAAVRRTFTLREFADLAPLVRADPDAGRSAAGVLDTVVSAAPRARARRRGAVDDVPDPYRGSAALHAQVLAQIEDAVDRLTAVLLAPVAHRA